MGEREFNKEDFTEDELKLLRMAFSLANTAIKSNAEDNYDVYQSNTLYSLEVKLGIYELVKDIY